MNERDQTLGGSSELKKVEISMFPKALGDQMQIVTDFERVL